MKIISKYKDFYDFIVQDHDADINYVRQIDLIDEYLDDMFKREGNSLPYYSDYTGYSDRLSYKKDNGEVLFDNFIFGIYPFVFAQPILRVFHKYRGNGSIDNTFIILGKELVDKLLDSNAIVSKSVLDLELLPLAQKEFDSLADRHICDHTKVHFSVYYNKFENLQKSLKSNTWKIDCPEFFYKIQSPVFVKNYYELFINGAYWENWPRSPKIGNSGTTHYVTNISFQKLNYNILKYWYNDLFDLNTYINIENFLWSIKQEPESNPDNKTKILAHGFDLKTSFRKM